MQPDVVPAPERRVDVVVIARELRRQVGVLESAFASAMLSTVRSSTNTCGAMQHEAANRSRSGAGMDQRDRSAVAVTDQDGVVDGELRRALREGRRAPRGACSPRRAARRAGPTCRTRSANRRAPGSRLLATPCPGKSFHSASDPRPSCRNTSVGAPPPTMARPRDRSVCIRGDGRRPAGNPRIMRGN